eukprot:CAMPEP_0119498324 /NCGR_PEP_ID=MMETSP1344-20130328/21098_1 /TAXON_ID=236787 /ORGANISM="Florenciella parvula, Strain CCMP2471" /LENGTH=181 /DNA_ID=CAMNT_0007534191 /DNA_START=177 /DNA_END=722 /DNA_ORIENTATION=-
MHEGQCVMGEPFPSHHASRHSVNLSREASRSLGLISSSGQPFFLFSLLSSAALYSLSALGSGCAFLANTLRKVSACFAIISEASFLTWNERHAVKAGPRAASPSIKMLRYRFAVSLLTPMTPPPPLVTSLIESEFATCRFSLVMPEADSSRHLNSSRGCKRMYDVFFSPSEMSIAEIDFDV